MASMGVEFIVLLSYLDDYDPGITGFNALIWYNDEWVARALNEFQIVFVVTWSDLVIRSMFSLGLVITTTSMKKLLTYLPQNANRIAQSTTTNVVAVRCAHNSEFLGTIATVIPAAIQVQPRMKAVSHVCQENNMCTRSKSILMQATRVIFVVWGAVVFGFHIHASLQPTLPQCLTQVRPWVASEPSCYLAGLDCHALQISGEKHEVESMWGEFDSSTVVQLLIRHCFALDVPDAIVAFHALRGIKVYNTTIVNWGESAAITSTNHPELSSLYIVRVNFTYGLLPAGFRSLDIPKSVNDIEMCITNLREIPDDLDTKWPIAAIIQIEYSQLTTVPLTLTRLMPRYLYLTGNALTELPPEVFEVDGMAYLDISDMNIHELPRNVATVSPSLSLVEIDNTNISYFWSWVDELVGRDDNPTHFVAGHSTYCEELQQQFLNDTVSSFYQAVPPEYSTILMNTSTPNREVIARVVDCNIFDDAPFYPLAYEDEINAISSPPVLRPQ